MKHKTRRDGANRLNKTIWRCCEICLGAVVIDLHRSSLAPMRYTKKNTRLAQKRERERERRLEVASKNFIISGISFKAKAELQ